MSRRAVWKYRGWCRRRPSSTSYYPKRNCRRRKLGWHVDGNSFGNVFLLRRNVHMERLGVLYNGSFYKRECRYNRPRILERYAVLGLRNLCASRHVGFVRYRFWLHILLRESRDPND